MAAPRPAREYGVYSGNVIRAVIASGAKLYRRGDSGFWWCSATVSGKQRRASTKEENLALAQSLAEDWYLELRGKSRAGLPRTEKTFRQAADQFTKEYGIITEGQRSARWVGATRAMRRRNWSPNSGLRFSLPILV